MYNNLRGYEFLLAIKNHTVNFIYKCYWGGSSASGTTLMLLINIPLRTPTPFLIVDYKKNHTRKNTIPLLSKTAKMNM